jgi:hypothetical protein
MTPDIAVDAFARLVRLTAMVSRSFALSLWWSGAFYYRQANLRWRLL